MRVSEVPRNANKQNYYVYQITPYDLNESYDNYCI